MKNISLWIIIQALIQGIFIRLDKINKSIEEGNSFFRKPTGLLSLTELHLFMNFSQEKLVANCHKIPQKFFEKRLLTHQELTDSIYNTILN
jgi:hypothetical protein